MKEQQKEYRKKYYEENKECLKEISRREHQNYKEKTTEYRLKHKTLQ